MERTVDEYVPLSPLAQLKLNDRVQLSNYTVDQATNLPFQLITAYDNRGISTALAGFIVKSNLGADAVTTDHLSEELMLLVLGIRFALTLANVASESIAEDKRHQKELKRKQKIDERYRAMFEEYLKLLEAVQEQLKQGIIPKWSDYNSTVFSSILKLYSHNSRKLSEQEVHLFYAALRLAIPAAHLAEVFEKFNRFRENNNDQTRIALIQSVELGLAARVKPTSVIKNKRVRSLLRNLKRVGDFIMANVTGLAIVTILASYIAISPVITVIMFYVYIAAIVVGVVFALLKVARDLIERRHEKIAAIENEEKAHYKQSQAMKKLSDNVKNLSDESETAQQQESISNDNNAVQINILDRSFSEGGSLLWRILISFPITAAVSSVSGWWAVTTVSGVVTGLGGPALVGAALGVAPIICAVIVTLFSLTKSMANLYREYHVEQEDIQNLHKECDIQDQAIRSNKVLRAVSKLSDAELLRCYIAEYLNQVSIDPSKENRKEVLHNIQKIIGVKYSDAVNPYAFYCYLASKLLRESHNSKGDHNNALILVSQFKAHCEEREFSTITQRDKGIVISRTFFQKRKSASEKFTSKFDALCAIIMPVIIGLGLAAAFVTGPLFPVVAIGLIGLLGILSYVNAQIKNGYAERKMEREKFRVKMAVCDEAALFLLRSGHQLPAHQEAVIHNTPSEGDPTIIRGNVSLANPRGRFFETPAIADQVPLSRKIDKQKAAKAEKQDHLEEGSICCFI